MTYPSEDGMRYRQLRRILNMIFLLCKRSYPVSQLSKQFQVSTKTIRRDLAFIEEVGIPVYSDSLYDDASDWNTGNLKQWYRIDHRWADQFLKRKVK